MTSPPMTKREYAYFAVKGQGSSSVITERLGWEPDQEWSEGDTKQYGGTHQYMRWRRDSGLPDTASLSEHVEALLDILPARTDQIRRLAPDYQAFIVCVGYYPASGHGLLLRQEWLQTAAYLGLSLDLDFYFLSDEGHDG